ncbi:MAG: DUF4276 family protein [Acidocella sp.]|nr:DUF4276 family protein [Acidocella sp.]
MKFIRFVEGHTEHKAVPAFLKRWLDARLREPVGIKSVRFEGWPELVADMQKKAHLYLAGANSGEVIAVISLLDLYGPTIYPRDKQTAGERCNWGKAHFEKQVGHHKFRHFFAIHKTEAWLLSEPKLFPAEIGERLPGKVSKPETVNFDQPPAVLLDNLYRQTKGRSYKKVVYGSQLFAKLNPEVAYDKCPALKALLDEMLRLAKDAGLARLQ